MADLGEEIEEMQERMEVDRLGSYTDGNDGGLRQDGALGLIYFYIV